MRLIVKIVLRLAAAILLVSALWGFVFYFVVVDEVNDADRDALQYRFERLKRAYDAGEPIDVPTLSPSDRVSVEDAVEQKRGRLPRYDFSDDLLYIDSEWEPVCKLEATFEGTDGRLKTMTLDSPSLEKDDLIEKMLMWVSILFGALLVVVVAVTWIIVGHSLRPLKRLLAWIDSIDLNSSLTPLDNPTNVTEFRKLNMAADRFVRRNKALFEQQKEFIGNASHEMQTPLAVCQNRMELLCESELSEQQFEQADAVLDRLDYMRRLNRSLLLLPKIENGNFDQHQRVVINDVVRRSVGQMSEIFASKNIDVQVVDNGEFVVEGDSSLLEMLVGNLLKNSFLHNVDGGKTVVSVDPHRFCVANTACSQALDGTRVFERFYQGGVRSERSTGLGLAIVDAVCKRCRLSVDYSFVNSMHCFTVRSLGD